ncbi:hypothetical protein [Sandaracinus amylolyticus]|uniref:hypothetical protein n=1 Tax=Sandaracinus amylolyticus TaxID=927083 RepID=UPI001F249A67|nr:hypothetical protein [Sandaracinus amylolyticus]UJR78286.1 Hypothetical protein I5071_3130 [Sandaracinus amylolyticus]
MSKWESWPGRRLEPGETLGRVAAPPHAACVAIGHDALHAALGPPHHEGDLDGIGPFEEWAFEWPCGCRAAVCCVHPLGEMPEIASILANDADVDHVLFHVALPGGVTWRADGGTTYERVVLPQRWRLARQDDNGIRAVMHTFDSRFAAECARATYEARGHKQLYSVEPA